MTAMDDSEDIATQDLMLALLREFRRAKQRRIDKEPCPNCGGDRLRADFTNPNRCHVPRKIGNG